MHAISVDSVKDYQSKNCLYFAFLLSLCAKLNLFYVSINLFQKLMEILMGKEKHFDGLCEVFSILNFNLFNSKIPQVLISFHM